MGGSLPSPGSSQPIDGTGSLRIAGGLLPDEPQGKPSPKKGKIFLKVDQVKKNIY